MRDGLFPEPVATRQGFPRERLESHENRGNPLENDLDR